MSNKELIKKIKPIDSVVDFFRFKPIILSALGGKDVYGETHKRLSKLPMKELRKIGDKIGAKDTSKDELIEEIIVKTPNDKLEEK